MTPKVIESPNLPVYGFMHIATRGAWRDVVAEQMALLRSSGLYKRTEQLLVGIVGPENDSFQPADGKVSIVHRSANVEEFEFPTLERLHQFCRDHHCLVYYIHTKGVFRDGPGVADWRRYMEYFVIECHEDCIAALRTHDVCGVNWHERPWPHFGGNFWWARSDYVKRLNDLAAMDVVRYLDHSRRHNCERWIGSGAGVRPACLHQSHVLHYIAPYPREDYAGPVPSAVADWPERSITDGSWLQPDARGVPPIRVAVVFDNLVRPDTTGTYCLRALRGLVRVTHFLPSEIANAPADAFDLFLYVDDGLEYQPASHLRPSALWAIDTHLNPERLVRRCANVDFVFAAQRDGVDLLRANGVDCLGWLPLGCDPDLHRPLAVANEFDVCFVGHLSTDGRRRLGELVSAHFPRSFVGQRFFGEMVAMYSASHIVLNLSVRNDVNMRVFEALACGSLLVTNDLADNGLAELFADGEHLVTYAGEADLVAKLEYYLADDAARSRIAARGRQAAIGRHTYAHRMRALLNAFWSEPVFRRPSRPRDVGWASGRHELAAIAIPAFIRAEDPRVKTTANQAPAEALTSVVIITFNALDYTRRCLNALRRCTVGPYEIVVIDNGSTDGTRAYLRAAGDVRLTENASNRGFPAAANQGIKASRGERIVLLNNDVVVTPGWLQRLTDALASAPDVGLSGPCSNSVSGDQRVDIDYHDVEHADDFAARWASANAGRVEPTERLVGFCLLFRRDLVDRIGYLDERFGIGNFEDDDYCFRARLAGLRAVIARDCFVHHFGSVTFKASAIDYNALMERNRGLFREKWAREGAQPPGTVAGASVPTSDVARPRLSICMIVRDSSRTLQACLDSVRPWVDEMIVVDTGSQDDTAAIARATGATVLQFPWCDDFSAARNHSLDAATGDWIFWMDADDTIDQANGRALGELVGRTHPSTTLGFVMQVHCPAGAESGAYATETVVDHVKVFRNLPTIRFSGRIHEQVLPAIRRLGGTVEWTDLFVVHSGSDSSADGRSRKHARDLRILELELAETPDSTFTLFNLGMTLLDMKRPADALAPLCRSLQLASEGESHVGKVYAMLVQCYAELGRFDTALWTCQRGLTAHPKDPELLFRRGVLEISLGRLDDAERSFRALLDPRSERRFASLDRGILGIKAWHNLAIVYEKTYRQDLAAAAWRHVLEYDKRNAIAWRGLLDALTAMRDEHGLEEASRLTGDGSLPPDVPFIACARLLVEQGKVEAAVTRLEEAARTRPSVWLLNEICELAFRHDLLETAEQWLQELVVRCPDDASAWQNLASVSERLGRFTQSGECARRSLELRPNYPPAEKLLERSAKLADAATESR